jgi:hypothetical protein
MERRGIGKVYAKDNLVAELHEHCQLYAPLLAHIATPGTPRS